MQRQFTITTPAQSIRTDANGHAEVVFTVANTTSGPAAGVAKLVPLGATLPEWLVLGGAEERDFPAGAMHQFTVAMNVPADVAAGRYPFRLDIINARKAAEDHAESPIVTVEVPARAAAAKGSRSLMAIFALAVLLVLAGAGYLMFRAPEPEPLPIVTAATAAVVTDTATQQPVEAKLVTVPNLITVAVNKAEWELENAGLKSARKDVVDSAATPGTVRMHAPKPGAQVEKGSTVELEVVVKSDLVAIPEVIGAGWGTAQQAIEKAGLVPVIGNHETKEWGRAEGWGQLLTAPAKVTAQTPAAGTEVKPGTRVVCDLYGAL
jgi:hypothetical protein